jgi:hypothetical protein
MHISDVFVVKSRSMRADPHADPHRPCDHHTSRLEYLMEPPSVRALAIAAASAAVLNVAPGQRDRAIEEATKAVSDKMKPCKPSLYLKSSISLPRLYQSIRERRVMLLLLNQALKRDQRPHTKHRSGVDVPLESLYH